jgi:hypothetical protein
MLGSYRERQDWVTQSVQNKDLIRDSILYDRLTFGDYL